MIIKEVLSEGSQQHPPQAMSSESASGFWLLCLTHWGYDWKGLGLKAGPQVSVVGSTCIPRPLRGQAKRITKQSLSWAT